MNHVPLSLLRFGCVHFHTLCVKGNTRNRLTLFTVRTRPSEGSWLESMKKLKGL